MITIALIDDHLIVRSGFAQLLGLEPDLQVVAEFGSGQEALAGLPGRGVQVCICDISMPDIAVKLAAGRQDPLTRRERQVAEKLAQGMAVKEIAAELGLSPKTVHVHRANLLEKLGVSNDVELARRMFDGW
ncbi:DNA-binding transcriptional activator UhpA [Citrobacter koseri]|uniref:Transcriptional regulatory protein UhpA n=1 Tax=Citrobacter koseri TaxID=545 RepID=A0A078LDP3_CITKO|nr:DNA-binding transcriptional activator UhpA [Citrobacter koseri]